MPRHSLLPAFPVLAVLLVAAAPPPRASFDCTKVKYGSTDELICKDDTLSALDLRLAGVYAAAAKKAKNEQPPVLAPEQRGWIKGRDECGMEDDRRGCIEREYRRRILELQARYRLMPTTGTATFACDDTLGKELVVTFFATDPPSMIAARGDWSALLLQVRSASGIHYVGANETYREHQGEVTVTWSPAGEILHCRRRK